MYFSNCSITEQRTQSLRLKIRNYWVAEFDMKNSFYGGPVAWGLLDLAKDWTALTQRIQSNWLTGNSKDERFNSCISRIASLRWRGIWSERMHPPCKFSFNDCYLEIFRKLYNLKLVFKDTNSSFRVPFIAWHGLCNIKFHRRLTNRSSPVEKSLSLFISLLQITVHQLFSELFQNLSIYVLYVIYVQFNTACLLQRNSSFALSKQKSKLLRTFVLL